MCVEKRFLNHRRLTWLLAASVIVLGTACVASDSTPASVSATSTAKASLTMAHEAEVRSAIEGFELRWHSLEAITNPQIESEVATGPYLEFRGNAHLGDSIYDEPFWLVIKSVEVRSLRVLEYSPERFKALASVDRWFDKTTTEGVVIESSIPSGLCGIYVFLSLIHI